MMVTAIFFLSLLAVIMIHLPRSNAGHVYSWDVSVTYGQSGTASCITLPFMLQSGLGANEFIRIDLPFTLGATAQAQLANAQQATSLATNITAVHTSLPNAQNTYTYIYAFGTTIIANNWYNLTMCVPTSSVTTINAGYYPQPISFYTLSSGTSPNPIIYDFTTTFGTIDIQSAPSSGLVTASIYPQTATLSQMQQGGNSYFIYIKITPLITYNAASAWTLFISQPQPDFTFQGSCYSMPQGSQITQVQSTCTISQDSQSMTFVNYNTLTANQAFSIAVGVQNPLYQAQRDLIVFANALTVDQRTLAYTKACLQLSCTSPALITNYLNFAPVSPASSINSMLRFKFLWGLDPNTVQGTQTVPYNQIFMAQSGGLAGPLNSLYIGFSFKDPSPVGCNFTLHITVRATGILEGSILTNLPAVSSNVQSSCYYSAPDIVCVNVGAILDTTKEYFVSFKAYYAYGSFTANSTIPNYGQIIIYSNVLLNTGALYTSAQLYATLPGDSTHVLAFQNSEYLDTAGWHSSSSFGLGTTQIVSAYEDAGDYIDSTPIAILSFFNSSQSTTVGIVPDSSLGAGQQLLFLLKVTEAQYCGTAPCSNNSFIRMNVLMNTNVLQFVSGEMAKGIDFAGWDPASGIWDIASSTCYLPNTPLASYCRWHDMNTVGDVQYSVIQQNIINQTYGQNFAIASFDCGASNSLYEYQIKLD